jgi:low affinity Fe/Cu permease
MARRTRSDERPSAGTLDDRFREGANVVTRTVGSPWAMVAALAVVVAWALTGPIFHFSDTWQLVINTGTTIVTFLMVFAIQTSQNRDARAIHLKLDELIRATPKARNAMLDEEHESEERIRADERRILEDVERATAAAEGRVRRAGRRRGR